MSGIDGQAQAVERRIAREERRPNPVLAAARRRLVRTEKQEEVMGDRLMASYGFEVVRFSQARASMQTEGIPDRRYYHRARRLTVWWEAKKEGGKQRKDQRRFQLMAEACGEVYVLGTHEVLADWLRVYFIGQDRGDAKMTRER